jgi:hypothetical protein
VTIVRLPIGEQPDSFPESRARMAGATSSSAEARGARVAGNVERHSRASRPPETSFPYLYLHDRASWPYRGGMRKAVPSTNVALAPSGDAV